MAVPHQPTAQIQRRPGVSSSDKIQRRHYRDPPFPKAFGRGQNEQSLFTFLLQVTADDPGRRQIDQVPIIDPAGMAQIIIIQSLFPVRRGGFEFGDQKDERGQTFFVYRAFEDPPDIMQLQVRKLTGDPSLFRHRHAEEHVPLSVLSAACLKKAL